MYLRVAVSPQGLYIDEMYFSHVDEAVDLTKYDSGYLFNNEIMDCNNVVPTYGVDISDRMYEALQSFLSDEYDGEHASKFDICDLKQVGEVTYVVSFRRVSSGKGVITKVWVGLVTWDDDRAEWDLREVEQTDRNSLA